MCAVAWQMVVRSVLDFGNWKVSEQNGVWEMDDGVQERDRVLGSVFKMDWVSGDAAFMTVLVVGALLVVVWSGSRRLFDEYSVMMMMMMMIMSPEDCCRLCLLMGLVVCDSCVLSAM
jgi:hypothetical protein